MVVRILKAAAVGVQAGVVGSESVALLAAVRFRRRVKFLKSFRPDAQVVLVGKILQVQFRSSALRNAHRRPRQLQRAGQPAVPPHHKPLPVVEHRLREVPPLRLARAGNGNGARHQIHFAGLNGNAHFGGGNRAELNGVRVAQNGGGHRPAQINIKPHIVAVLQEPETGVGVVPGADQIAPRPYRLQPAPASGALLRRPRRAGAFRRRAGQGCSQCQRRQRPDDAHVLEIAQLHCRIPRPALAPGDGG